MELPMSRQDMADYLGLTIETVCRVLSAMKRNGLVDIPNLHQLVIKKPAVLAELAEAANRRTIMALQRSVWSSPAHRISQGSPDHGYEFIAPLTADGHIDAKAWKDVKDRCEVTRFWAGVRNGLAAACGRGLALRLYGERRRGRRAILQA
jgi:hypothetical protein